MSQLESGRWKVFLLAGYFFFRRVNPSIQDFIIGLPCLLSCMKRDHGPYNVKLIDRSPSHNLNFLTSHEQVRYL